MSDPGFDHHGEVVAHVREELRALTDTLGHLEILAAQLGDGEPGVARTRRDVLAAELDAAAARSTRLAAGVRDWL